MTRGGCIDGKRCVDSGDVEKMDRQTCTEILARLSKGLAHPARLAIIRMLYHKPPEKQYICSDIVNALPLAQASVSQHLKILNEAGWVYREVDGPRVACVLVGNIVEYYKKLVEKAVQKNNT